jgi:hypothetical protein
MTAKAGVRYCWSAAVIAVCTAPSAAANVWPRVTEIWAKGAATGPQVAIALVLTVSAVALAAVPFAIEKAPNWPKKLGYLAVGLGLATFNFFMGIDTAGQWYASRMAPAAVTAAKAAALKSRIDRATAAKAQLPQLPRTSAAQVTAADEAVREAKEAVRQECDKVGDNCRKRQDALTAKTDKRAELLAARTNTEKVEGYDTIIEGASKDLVDLGPIPTDVDPTAARIAKVASLIIDLGPRGDLKVIEWLPTFIAAMIELVAMWVPNLIMTATAAPYTPGAAPATWFWRWRQHAPADAATVDVKPAAPAAAPSKAAVKPTAASAAMPKKASKIKPAALADAESVRQWFKSRTIARAGSKLKPKETYEGSYLPWCEEMNIAPVSFTKFGITMKAKPGDGGCSVEFESNASKRDYYVGIAIVGSSLRVVPGGAEPRLGRMARR